MANTKITIDGSVGLFMDKLKTRLLWESPDLMMKAAWIATGEVRREVVDKAKGGTGGLARSFEPKTIKTTEKETIVGTFSDLPYARIQDEGGTITAKRGFRAIPIGDRARRVAGLWPRDWPQKALFAFKSKRGNVLLARSDREPGDSDFLQYLLRRSVTLSKHPLKGYLTRASKKASPLIEDLVSDGIQAEIDDLEAGK